MLCSVQHRPANKQSHSDNKMLAVSTGMVNFNTALSLLGWHGGSAACKRAAQSWSEQVHRYAWEDASWTKIERGVCLCVKGVERLSIIKPQDWK